MLARMVGSGSRSDNNRATWMAQIFPCRFAEKADFGIGAAMVASPITCTPGCKGDSNDVASIGHQPVWSVTPACSAMAAAFCGGITLATSAFTVSKSV